MAYDVTRDGNGIHVEVTVTGGPRPSAWVGFGASLLGTDLPSREILQVAARSSNGAPISVAQVGDSAYRVDIVGNEPWVFAYRVELGSPPAAAYQRASSASADHVMLIGVDVWARFFDSALAIGPPSEDRPLGEVDAATVRFDLDSLPRGWQVASASPARSLDVFELTDHPARSAFALGPYRFQDIDRDLGLRAAIHKDFTVARDQVSGYARQLARAQAREFGPPPGDPTLMIFTPLPRDIRPRQGVRTAGMVWDRTLVLFAGAGPSAPTATTRVREMMAVFLGHELFHLYVPWGLPITQPLSWLSEGWAEHVGRNSAEAAGILSKSGFDRSLREAYDSYREMGGAQAGSLQNASESGEDLRDLLYVRGELVFRILALEWQASGKPGAFNSVLWRRLQNALDGDIPLEPEDVSSILSAMVSPTTVRRFVDSSAVITLPELRLGGR